MVTLVDHCKCGAEIQQPATGRRRLKCEECSPRRVRDRRVGALPAVAAVPAAVRPPTAPVRLPSAGGGAQPDGPGRVEAATLAELEAAERAGTSAGVEALHLARLLDAGGYTAQGAAALAKARREALAVALEGAKVAEDALDELRRRRLAKAAGA